jgi:hypothetical protein
MDAYFYHRSGHRQTFAERPSQVVPASLLALLSSLEHHQTYGFTRVTEFLLDLRFSVRADLGDRLTQFASPKNNAETLTFADTDNVVVLLRGQRSQKELDEQAARHSSLHKNVLILAVDPTGRSVLGWTLKSTA